MPDRPTAAQALYPHLRQSKPDEAVRRSAPKRLASALYPNLVPPKPPRPQMTWDELWELDPERVQMIGLERKRR
jgi:hypothetical protein